MPELSYRKNGLVLRIGAQGPEVRDLQHNLRQLGYLQRRIDGIFGNGTELAVKSLSYDLLKNDGGSRGADGRAEVRVVDYNRGRIFDITANVDQALAGCISDMLDDQDFPKLPKSDDPVADNKKIISQIVAMRSREVPIPFLLGILKQESDVKHYNEPAKNDEDTYIVVGLDANASEKYIITSRGYGTGQYTLFHHPPRKEEVDDFMLDIGKNIEKAIRELRGKFDNFVVGRTSGTKADDRIAEIGSGPLRLCKFSLADPLYMTGCKECLIDSGSAEIKQGLSPLYEGSSQRYVPTQCYGSASYEIVPVRKKIGCDWPYAVRRYNGSGMNSYHYQTRVMKYVVSLDIV